MIEFSLFKKLHSIHGVMNLNVSCTIETGEFISLYGPSGAGKTSLLRMIAGFMKPDNGVIKVDGETWFNSENKIDIIPQKRNIGFVFQDYALFPNMNVKQNIAFALSKKENKNSVDEWLEFIGLTGLRDKKIYALSGGQQQRVALARALIKKPKLLLLDEPLDAIDNEMRWKLQETLLKIHAEYNITAILVSHDINEIIKLTTKTLYIENGILKKYEQPVEIFLHDNDDAFSIKAVFLSKKKMETKYELCLLAGNQIIKIFVQQNDCENLQKGDEIIISLKDATPLIRKL